MPHPESDPCETVDTLRRVADESGLPFAIEEARALAVGAVGFIAGETGNDAAEEFLRELLAAVPEH